MSAPVLSLIIPNYNHKDRLPRLLDSLLCQKDLNFETIIVDDCSDSSCDDLVEGYRGKGLALRVIYHQERRFTKNARITGIKVAQGRVIAFVDADDWLLGTDILATHVERMERELADILHFRSLVTDEAEQFQRYAHVLDPFAVQLAGRAIFQGFLDSGGVKDGSTVWNKLYSKELCDAVCPLASLSKVLLHVEDLYLTSLFMMHAKKYISSDLVGYAYRYVKKDRSNGMGRALCTLKMRKEVVPYMRKHGWPDAAVVQFAQQLDHYLSICIGRLSLALESTQDGDIPDSIVEEIAALGDTNSLLKVLLISNKINANKIVNSIITLQRYPAL